MRVPLLLARISILICSALFLLPAASTHAQSAPSSNDLWDVSQGTVRFGPDYSGPFSSMNDMFGATDSSRNKGRAVFGMQDGLGRSEWRTATPVRVNKIAFFADYNPDGPFYEGQHPFSNIKFFVRELDGTFKEMYSFSPSIPYGGGINGTELAHEADIAPVEGQHFRVEITPSIEVQYIRVIELDAFGETLPPLEIPTISNDDQWDFSQGAIITGHSPLNALSTDIRDTFGGQFNFGSNKGRILFADRLPKDTVHWIEWRTPEPITLERFNIFAFHDFGRIGPTGPIRDIRYRGFRIFRLFAKNQAGEFELLHEYNADSPFLQFYRDDGQRTPFESNSFLHAADIDPTRAQEFRAEFVQYASADELWSSNDTGPRIIELDGFGEIATDPEPVVLVPGMLASINPKTTFLDKPGDYWTFVIPARGVYSSLIQQFELAGHLENEKLFIAHYDWRKPVSSNVETYLKPVIERAKQVTGRDKVDIVAHSMGGLLARSYIQSDGYQNDVDQLITLGTPHEGAADSYVAWEGGDFPTTWSSAIKLYIRTIINSLNASQNTNLEPPLAFRTFFSSLKDLLPITTFITKNDAEIPVNSLTEQNNFLQDLQTEVDELENKGIDMTAIIGNNIQTLKTITLTANRTIEDGALQRWRDGHPLLEPISPDSSEGDQRVLTSSASLGESIVPLANANHEKLPHIAKKKILEILGIESETFEYEPPDFSEIFGITILSPIDPKITCGDQVLSKDENTFPEAQYIADPSDPDAPKVLVIGNPPAGGCQVALTGTGSGPYHAITCFADENQDGCTTREGTTSPGKVETYQALITEDGYQAPPEDIAQLADTLFRSIPRLLKEKHIKAQAVGLLTSPAANMKAFATAYTQAASTLGFEHAVTKNQYSRLQQAFATFSLALDQQINLGRMDEAAIIELTGLRGQLKDAGL